MPFCRKEESERLAVMLENEEAGEERRGEGRGGTGEGK